MPLPSPTATLSDFLMLVVKFLALYGNPSSVRVRVCVAYVNAKYFQTMKASNLVEYMAEQRGRQRPWRRPPMNGKEMASERASRRLGRGIKVFRPNA